MASEDPLIINEAQLILAEKRTYLASLRTGITVMALPMTVISFLIAASHYYQAAKVLGLLVPLLLVCTLLGAVGAYLVLRAMLKLHRAEKMLKELKAQHSLLNRFIT